MENQVTKDQLNQFHKLVEQIDQLGQDLGPAVVHLKELNDLHEASYSWGPDDYAKPAYRSHMRQNQITAHVLEALLFCAQSSKAL